MKRMTERDPRVRFGGALLKMTLMILLALYAPATSRAEDEISEKDRLKNSIISDSVMDFPWDYIREPGGFRETPPGYRGTPLNYREKPLQYQVVPGNFREKISGDIGLPRGYSPTPPNFIEKDSHPLVNMDPEKQMSNDTHPLKNERTDFRISIDDNPLTNKTISKSLEDVD